jgi:hypothetical protein
MGGVVRAKDGLEYRSNDQESKSKMTNDLLVKLVADLEIATLDVFRLQKGEGDDAEYLASCERHWKIREAINATPARTLPALQAKARATEIARDLDASADCEGEGSFVELSRSLIADMKTMRPAPHVAA